MWTNVRAVCRDEVDASVLLLVSMDVFWSVRCDLCRCRSCATGRRCGVVRGHRVTQRVGLCGRWHVMCRDRTTTSVRALDCVLDCDLSKALISSCVALPPATRDPGRGAGGRTRALRARGVAQRQAQSIEIEAHGPRCRLATWSSPQPHRAGRARKSQHFVRR